MHTDIAQAAILSDATGLLIILAIGGVILIAGVYALVAIILAAEINQVMTAIDEDAPPSGSVLPDTPPAARRLASRSRPGRTPFARPARGIG